MRKSRAEQDCSRPFYLLTPTVIDYMAKLNRLRVDLFLDTAVNGLWLNAHLRIHLACPVACRQS